MLIDLALVELPVAPHLSNDPLLSCDIRATLDGPDPHVSGDRNRWRSQAQVPETDVGELFDDAPALQQHVHDGLTDDVGSDRPTRLRGAATTAQRQNLVNKFAIS